MTDTRFAVKHGYRKGGRMSPTYKSWISMRNRCNDPNATAYAYYGGAGIRVCERWNDFQAFLDDMGERPNGTTLGRIGDKGNYEPGNCVWQTRSEQAKRGSENGRAKLTDEQVLCIRSLYKSKARRGCSAKNMAQDLGVNLDIIYRVIRGNSWSHLQ